MGEWSARLIQSGYVRVARQNEAARAADATACIDTIVGTVLLKNGWLWGRMTQMVARTATSMKINNNVLVKVPVWQGF